jgi:DNA polymerase III alpha subunit (gram-positive type)
MNDETYISVDIETSGPIPGIYSLLSLGACVVGSPSMTFYREFKPTTDNYIPEALAVSGLQLSKLSLSGVEPMQGFQEFKSWIDSNCRDAKPVFVGFNAPFDWSFVNYYFHVFLKANPFGFSALDIKAYFMGLTGCTWDDTRSSRIAKILETTAEIHHNALQDSISQAKLFEQMKILADKRTTN